VVVLGAAFSVGGSGALAACGSGSAISADPAATTAAPTTADPSPSLTDSATTTSVTTDSAQAAATVASSTHSSTHSTTHAATHSTSKTTAKTTTKTTTKTAAKTPAKTTTKTTKATVDDSQGALLKLSAVPIGGSVVVSGIVVTRTGSSRVVGHSVTCTHQGCAVKPSGPHLNCPCHGSVFVAASGAVVNGPAQRPLPGVSLVVKGDYIHQA
jgi:Rieske Fe-S protein